MRHWYEYKARYITRLIGVLSVSSDSVLISHDYVERYGLSVKSISKRI